MKERRQINRSAERLSLVVYDFSCDLTARTAATINISRTGFCVEGGAPLKIGEAISFIMTLPGLGRVSGRGVCRWSDGANGRRRWGARIEQLPDEDQVMLSRYLEQRGCA